MKGKDLAGERETRPSNLQAIFVRGEPEECIGLLIQLIPIGSFGDLLISECWKHGEVLYYKWEDQIKATVEVLHAHYIIWADINAGNVVIDKDSNAWVIDFGGRSNPVFVDDDKAETIEGDWQGIKRLFEVWLPKQISSR